MIRGYVKVHPGDCYTEIGRNLGLTNGTLAYHLGVLEREGIVQSAAKGTKRCYYPAGMAVPEDGGGMHAIQKRILTSVEEVPGVSVGDLAAVLGVSSQLAIYHVRKLAEEGRVAFGRRGIKLRVYPAGYEEKEEDA